MQLLTVIRKETLQMTSLSEQIKRCKENDIYVQKINEILKERTCQENILYGLQNYLEFSCEFKDYELQAKPEGSEEIADSYHFFITKNKVIFFSGKIEVDQKLSCYRTKFNYSKYQNELNDDIVKLFEEGIG